MLASLAEAVLRRFGPFVVPVVLFAGGVAAYALLWLFYRWRDGGSVEESEPRQ
jgi:hypothetical protein